MTLAVARRLLALAASTAIVTACAGGSTQSSTSSTAPGSVTRAPLTILGAASLRGALQKAGAAWETTHPASPLTLSTDSSAALETQLEQGAPADVFVSADTTNPKKLVDKGLADGAAVNVAGNVLTIVVPTANPAGIRTPFDLARPGVKVIAAGDDVPITTYANEAVANLAKQPNAPRNFAAGYASNVVSKEDNVKAVIAKIELGEGDAGIVYVTDAKASTKVATVAIPDAANVPATYAGVVVKASVHAATAHEFLDWLAGPDGEAILKTFGFLPPAD
ncbi:MAG TPA: molybdate ABC transporter substrate-binding protein [Candidatus Limnocylindrales bacterium]